MLTPSIRKTTAIMMKVNLYNNDVNSYNNNHNSYNNEQEEDSSNLVNVENIDTKLWDIAALARKKTAFAESDGTYYS